MSRKMFETVSHHLQPDRFGGFVRKGNILISSRKINKFTVLQKITHISLQQDPLLRSKYINFSQIDDDKKVRINSPSHILLNILEKEKLSNIKEIRKIKGTNKVEPLLEILESKKLRVALFYDHTELLYSINSSARINFLQELRILANTNYKTCYVLLCGSSQVLPMLVENYYDPIISEQFPLKRMDLNGNKFSTIRIND